MRAVSRLLWASYILLQCAYGFLIPEVRQTFSGVGRKNLGSSAGSLCASGTRQLFKAQSGRILYTSRSWRVDRLNTLCMSAEDGMELARRPPHTHTSNLSEKAARLTKSGATRLGSIFFVAIFTLLVSCIWKSPANAAGTETCQFFPFSHRNTACRCIRVQSTN
jgi:hypothetical protein